MIVVGTLAVIAAIALPNFLRARKRAQAEIILEDLRVLDSAIDQYAIETSKSAGATANWADLRGFLKTGSHIYNSAGTDLFGASYIGYTVDSHPKLRPSSFDKLSDIAPSDFWSPFYP